MPTQIAVVGASAPSADALSQAEAVGRILARAGATLVCGGLGGIMEAAAKGAHTEGGWTVGLLPGSLRIDANPFIRCAIPTGLGHFRNFLVVQASDAVIAFPGRYGTLSEIAMALTLEKPVIGLATWDIEGVVRAETPEEAVRLALQAAPD